MDLQERRKKFSEFIVYMERISRYLEVGKYKEKLNRTQKKSIRKATSNGQYSREGKTLFYNHQGRKLRVITTEEERDTVLKENHNTDHAGHSGINSTIARISQHFWWKGMAEDVVAWIKRCDSCQRQETIKTQAPELKTIPLKEPLYMVGIDLVGPLKETRNGNKYILTMTDYFTKWVEFYPLKDKSALGVCKNIRSFVYRYGAPNVIISDRGREFVNTLNDQLSKEFKIKRIVSSAYHPQTNGLDERTNKTLKERLSKLVNNEQDDWDLYLEGVAYSMRTQKQNSTKYSPFYLMFKRQPNLMCGIDDSEPDCPSLMDMHVEENDIETYVKHKATEQHDVHMKVLQNVEKAQKKQRLNFQKQKSKGVRSFSFQIGDTVLRRQMRNIGRKGDKLADKWTGPYRITDIDTKQRVRLCNAITNQVLKDMVAYDQLKPYERPPTLIHVARETSPQLIAPKERDMSQDEICPEPLTVSDEPIVEDEKRDMSQDEICPEPLTVPDEPIVEDEKRDMSQDEICPEPLTVPDEPIVEDEKRDMSQDEICPEPLTVPDEPIFEDEKRDMSQDEICPEPLTVPDEPIFEDEKRDMSQDEICPEPLTVPDEPIFEDEKRDMSQDEICPEPLTVPDEPIFEDEKRDMSQDEICPEPLTVPDEPIVEAEKSTQEPFLKVGPYNLSRASFNYLRSTLTDEVIDAYLTLKSSDKDDVYYANCVVSTSLFMGTVDLHYHLKQMDLYKYRKIIFPVNEGDHWVLLVALPKELTLLYVNSLGEPKARQKLFLKKWHNFLKGRIEKGYDPKAALKWTIKTTPHAKQTDGTSCGMFVLKFAEKILQGESIDFPWSMEEIKHERVKVANELLIAGEKQKVDKPTCIRNLRTSRKKKIRSSFVYDIPMKKSRLHFCICGKPDDGRVYWQCEKCDRWFHPGCIGETKEPRCFICTQCKMCH